MYASESLQRWFSLATCLAGGMLGGGAPAASEPLQNNIALQHGPRVEAYVTHLTDDDYVIGEKNHHIQTPKPHPNLQNQLSASLPEEVLRSERRACLSARYKCEEQNSSRC